MRRTVLCLCFLAMLGFSLWAGGGQAASAPGTAVPEVDLGTAPSYPLAGNKTLKWWYPMDTRVLQFMTNYSENPAFQEIMRKTGVTIEFIHPSAQNAAEQFNLMIASGDLPDMIQTAQRYAGGEQQAYLDGVYQDLTPYIKNSAPDYYRLINSTDMAKKQGYKDGKIVSFYRLCFQINPPYIRPILRGDWLKEFGMEPPRILDEYEKYFQNILDKKPGVTPYFMDFGFSEGMDQFMGCYDMLYGWYGIDGKVYHFYDAPRYKEFLTRMNQWYSKGYLSKDFASLRLEQVFALYDSGQVGGYTQSVDTTYGRIYDNRAIFASAPDPRLTLDQKLHSGIAQWPVNPAVPDANAVTTACEDVETAVKFLNYGYTDEGQNIYTFGKQGLTWDYANGEPRFLDYFLNNPQGMTGGVRYYALAVHFGPKVALPDPIRDKAMAVEQRAIDTTNIRLKWSDDPNIDDLYRLLPRTLTSAELDEYSAIMTDVDAYANEMKLKFITGAEPLSNYDAYITRLNQLRFQRAKEIQQVAYDRIK